LGAEVGDDIWGGEGMVYPDYAGYTRRILGRESVRRTTEVHVDV
jgi:hypothetical protein